MPLPGKPFADWSKDDLDALVQDPPAVESARVDFKADCTLLSADGDERDKARRDILVDVSAMANGAGGALLIGVRQTGKRGQPPYAETITGIKEPERLKQAVDGLVNTHLDVRPGPLEYHSVAHEKSLAVLVVEVPANTYSLSMVTYDDLGQFWIRRGTDNRLMTTDEIEYKFGQFAKVRESAADELAEIRKHMVRPNHEAVIWFAGVPLARARDHVPVDVAKIKAILADSSYWRSLPNRRKSGSLAPHAYSRVLVPHLTGVRTSQERHFSTALDVRRNGTVIYSVELGSTPREVLSCERVERRLEVRLWRIYETILSGLHVFSDIQEHFGIAKAGIVQAGLVDIAQRFVVCGDDPFPDPDAPRFGEADLTVPLDVIQVDEHWRPHQVFAEWALQLANALGYEQTIPCPPWV